MFVNPQQSSPAAARFMQQQWPQLHEVQSGSSGMFPWDEAWLSTPLAPPDVLSVKAANWMGGSSSAGSPSAPSVLAAAAPHIGALGSTQPSSAQQYLLQLLQSGISIDQLLSATSHPLRAESTELAAEWAARRAADMLAAASSGSHISRPTPNAAAWKPVLDVADSQQDEACMQEQLLLFQQQLLQQKQQQEHFEQQLAQVVMSGTAQNSSIAGLLAEHLSAGASPFQQVSSQLQHPPGNSSSWQSWRQPPLIDSTTLLTTEALPAATSSSTAGGSVVSPQQPSAWQQQQQRRQQRLASCSGSTYSSGTAAQGPDEYVGATHSDIELGNDDIRRSFSMPSGLSRVSAPPQQPQQQPLLQQPPETPQPAETKQPPQPQQWQRRLRRSFSFPMLVGAGVLPPQPKDAPPTARGASTAGGSNSTRASNTAGSTLRQQQQGLCGATSSAAPLPAAALGAAGKDDALYEVVNDELERLQQLRRRLSAAAALAPAGSRAALACKAAAQRYQEAMQLALAAQAALQANTGVPAAAAGWSSCYSSSSSSSHSVAPRTPSI